MDTYVFQCYNEGSNKSEFTKTVKALHEYTAKKLTYPGDMWNLTTKLTELVVPEPKQITEQEMQDDFF